MAKMTKTQAKKRLLEIRNKANHLLINNFLSLKDCEAIHQIVKRRYNQLK